MTKKADPKRMAKAGGLMRRAAAVGRAVVDNPVGVLGVFERLALDKRLTVEKLGELIRLQTVIIERDARTAFIAAFQAMQPELPRIRKNGVILNRNKEVQSRFAKYEDIRAAVDPIMRRHGFTFDARTEWPETGTLEVVGTLTHLQGHVRESRFRTKADGSGGKNEIQGLGSGVQYGRRYTLKDLLSIVEEGVDDDGVKAGQSRRRDPEVVSSGAPAIPETHPDAGEPITQKQRQRFAMILKNSGRNAGDVRAWIKQRYGIESSAEIRRDKYDEICKAVESTKPLPLREPGED